MLDPNAVIGSVDLIIEKLEEVSSNAIDCSKLDEDTAWRVGVALGAAMAIKSQCLANGAKKWRDHSAELWSERSKEVV